MRYVTVITGARKVGTKPPPTKITWITAGCRWSGRNPGKYKITNNYHD
jgi:hypothetical protein